MCLHDLIPSIAPLLRSPLVDDGAYKAMYTLTTVLGTTIYL
jgi:hypothetical protein